MYAYTMTIFFFNGRMICNISISKDEKKIILCRHKHSVLIFIRGKNKQKKKKKKNTE
jgi:hypothetical protein